MSKKTIKDICVIGIGRFGAAVTEQLLELKKHVLAIDCVESNLVKIARKTNTAVLDATDVESLEGIGITRFETVIVANTSNNVEIAAALKELGVVNIIAKSSNKTHERVLRQIGVDVIIRPEFEGGVKAALIASNSNFIKYSESLQEIGDGYAIGSTRITNSKFIDKPLMNLNFANLGVSAVSIRTSGKVTLPRGDVQLKKDDIITIIGKLQNITKAFEELNIENDGEIVETQEVQTPLKKIKNETKKTKPVKKIKI